MGMTNVKVCAKFLLLLMSVQQKKGFMESCHALKEQSKTNTIFSKIITADKSWYHDYDPPPKNPVGDCKVASPKKSQVKSNTKAILICSFVFFFYVREVVHSEFIPSGQTINQSFYLEVLRRLSNSV